MTYAILVKHSMRFYTQIRYALPGLFHMWKPTFWGDLGRFSPKDSTPGLAVAARSTIVEGETVMRA